MDYNALNDAIGLGNSNLTDASGNITLGSIISALLPYVLTLSGIILLVMLITGGFTILIGATNPETQEKGKKRITSALLGFFILFAAYWIAQALQIIFKVDIVG